MRVASVGVIRSMVLAVGLVVAGSGCVPDQSDDPSMDGGDVGAGADVADAGADAGPTFGPVSDCDPLDPVRCALPWPSNLYLQPDESRTTGVELQFGEETLPASISGNHPDPEPYARLDGYGLGVPIMAVFPDLNADALPGRYDIPASMAEDAKILLYEVTGEDDLERVPYWAELDAQASEENSDEQILFVRPAEILEENTRYIVAFRNLEDESGASIQPSPAFRKLRDNEVVGEPTLSNRRERFEDVFERLTGAGVDRSSLTLAWDFRTASGDGLRGRMLTMRRKALDATGQAGPELEYESEDVREFAASEDETGRPVDSNIGLEIEGTYSVPHFMREVGDSRKWTFNLGEDGEVVQNGMRDARFLMRVPHSVLDGGEPAGVVVYGHGLLQSRDEIRSEIWSELADRYNYIVIATDWTGMAEGDRGTAASATVDISIFQGVADRLHQGMLEFLMLGRSARSHLPGLTALTSRNVTVDDEQVYFAGASQGGIYGQTVMALTEEFERGFLAVPGNNYSTLLQRSVGFDYFLNLMEGYYRTAATRALGVSTMQLLWNGVDPVNYATHIERDPIVPNPPEKDVLMTPSKGDYQVAVVTNEILSRSDAGIPTITPYDEEREPWNVPTATLPHQGSGILLFDFGNPWPDRRNRPPRDDGDDPHDNLADVEAAGQMINSFFRDGEIIDICDGGPCTF